MEVTLPCAPKCATLLHVPIKMIATMMLVGKTGPENLRYDHQPPQDFSHHRLL